MDQNAADADTLRSATGTPSVQEGRDAGVAVRIATVDDAAVITELAARTFRETFGPDNTADDMTAYLARSFGLNKQRRELADPSVLYLLATKGGDVAGYAMLQDSRDEAPACVAKKGEDAAPVELVRFYVTSRWHGQGVAQSLMSACVEHARTRGGRTLWLGVWERNARAIKFYEKTGFRDVGSQVFWLGGDRQIDRVMVRSLLTG
jgi:ribosomal protein S18 acetylase RimI-like enzyme